MFRPAPRRLRGHRLSLHALSIVAVAALGAEVFDIPDNDRARARPPAPVLAPATVFVGAAPVGPAVPRGFVGFSLEYPALIGYAGTNPTRVNPVFAQLLRNVTPGGTPVIRIGGDSTDITWWPIRGVHRPRGISYSLTPRWLRVTRRLATTLRARLILGVNLKAGNDRLSLAEAHALLRGIGPRLIAALEIGNEPGLYGRFPFYRIHGHWVLARPRNYGLAQFTRDFTTLATRLRGVPLAGPTLGIPPTGAELQHFLTAEPGVRIATVHRYPLNRCFSSPASPKFPTVPRLLSSYAGTGLVSTLGNTVAVAAKNGLPTRIDELNSVACSGKPGVSDTFAASLWVLDELFALTADRVAGVNIHTFPGAGYAPFAFSHRRGRWAASVRPLYYGLLAFANAAPPGARLLPVSVQSNTNLTAWATQTRNRRLHVVIINKAMGSGALVNLRLGLAHAATATVTRLTAPGPTARDGVSLGGRTFGTRTYTGRLTGRPTLTTLPAGGRPLRIRVPAASAALLTIALSEHPGAGRLWSRGGSASPSSSHT